ncbi:hypothetical protein EES45_36380 [Streptomyces sp. ADI97-07]|nr:hypothetical protein ASD51_33765 [Streptomyces sp. Root55]RPK69659.1 hypothetical protein EES45_36380 [Streptomyces sp. ADI97-07]
MYPVGPEGDIDQLADEKGWVMDGIYSSASEFVADMCESLPVSAVKEAVSGDYDRWFGGGTYLVSSKPPSAEQLQDDEDARTIPPGTYRAKGRMENCYWERTSEGGDIIDNNFATSAQAITVTIHPSDGQFTSEGCEMWKPVK